MAFKWLQTKRVDNDNINNVDVMLMVVVVVLLVMVNVYNLSEWKIFIYFL